MPGSELSIERSGDLALVGFRQAAVIDNVWIQKVSRQLMALIEDGARRLVLDFSDVTFLSSQMVGVLIDINRRLQHEGGRLVVCGIRAELMKIFEVMKLRKVIEIAADRSEALDRLGAREEELSASSDSGPSSSR
jgi:anti-anti-sigma factor